VHFATTVAERRGFWFQDPQLCTELLSLFEAYRQRNSLYCLGYVLMPDHLHAVLVQTTEDGTVSRMMEHFKRFTSHRLLRAHCPQAEGWRDLFDDVPVPGSHAIWTKLNYLHWNPCHKGLCTSPEQYQWSSARWYCLQKPGIVQLSDPPFPSL
jgi:putative transposase